MYPLKTEAVGRIAYGPHEPTSFKLSDDLLETYLGDRVYVRVGGQEASHSGFEHPRGHRRGRDRVRGG